MRYKSRPKLIKLLLKRRQLLLKLLARDERRSWVNNFNLNRIEEGAQENLFADMRLNDVEGFFDYFRMNPAAFDELLSLVGPAIRKLDTNYRKAISSSERLSITLRYLASGDSMTSIATSHRVGLSTTSKIIQETCQALWNCLADNYLKMPTTTEWEEFAEQFEVQTNFPNCVGAVDGKHVVVQAPLNSGSLFYNCEGTYSLILMAACNTSYCYSFVDIGDVHSSVFSDTPFGTAILEGNLNLPNDKEITDLGKPLPFVFVADEAFPLKRHLMRPYPEKDLTDSRRAFNYRLCRALSMIENTFGVTANRWRILKRPIVASVKTAEKIIKAALCLHNFVSQNEINSNIYQKYYCPATYVDREINGVIIPGLWRQENTKEGGWLDLKRFSSNTYSQNAKEIREDFEEYFHRNPLPYESTVINRSQFDDCE